MKGCGELEVQFHTFWKSVLDGGEWSASLMGCFVTGKEPLVSVKQGPGSAPDLVWALWRRETSLDPAGNQRKTSRSSSQYTNELPQLINHTHTHTIYIYIYVNKNPTRCNIMQIFIYCKVTLHVSGVTAPIIRNTKNCNRSLRYMS